MADTIPEDDDWLWGDLMMGTAGLGTAATAGLGAYGLNQLATARTPRPRPRMGPAFTFDPTKDYTTDPARLTAPNPFIPGADMAPAPHLGLGELPAQEPSKRAGFFARTFGNPAVTDYERLGRNTNADMRFQADLERNARMADVTRAQTALDKNTNSVAAAQRPNSGVDADDLALLQQRNAELTAARDTAAAHAATFNPTVDLAPEIAAAERGVNARNPISPRRMRLQWARLAKGGAASIAAMGLGAATTWALNSLASMDDPNTTNLTDAEREEAQRTWALIRTGDLTMDDVLPEDLVLMDELATQEGNQAMRDALNSIDIEGRVSAREAELSAETEAAANNEASFGGTDPAAYPVTGEDAPEDASDQPYDPFAPFLGGSSPLSGAAVEDYATPDAPEPASAPEPDPFGPDYFAAQERRNSYADFQPQSGMDIQQSRPLISPPDIGAMGDLEEFGPTGDFAINPQADDMGTPTPDSMTKSELITAIVSRPVSEARALVERMDPGQRGEFIALLGDDWRSVDDYLNGRPSDLVEQVAADPTMPRDPMDETSVPEGLQGPVPTLPEGVDEGFTGGAPALPHDLSLPYEMEGEAPPPPEEELIPASFRPPEDVVAPPDPRLGPRMPEGLRTVDAQNFQPLSGINVLPEEPAPASIPDLPAVGTPEFNAIFADIVKSPEVLGRIIDEDTNLGNTEVARQVMDLMGYTPEEIDAGVGGVMDLLNRSAAQDPDVEIFDDEGLFEQTYNGARDLGGYLTGGLLTLGSYPLSMFGAGANPKEGVDYWDRVEQIHGPLQDEIDRRYAQTDEGGQLWDLTGLPDDPDHLPGMALNAWNDARGTVLTGSAMVDVNAGEYPEQLAQIVSDHRARRLAETATPEMPSDAPDPLSEPRPVLPLFNETDALFDPFADFDMQDDTNSAVEDMIYADRTHAPPGDRETVQTGFNKAFATADLGMTPDFGEDTAPDIAPAGAAFAAETTGGEVPGTDLTPEEQAAAEAEAATVADPETDPDGYYAALQVALGTYAGRRAGRLVGRLAPKWMRSPAENYLGRLGGTGGFFATLTDDNQQAMNEEFFTEDPRGDTGTVSDSETESPAEDATEPGEETTTPGGATWEAPGDAATADSLYPTGTDAPSSASSSSAPDAAVLEEAADIAAAEASGEEVDPSRTSWVRRHMADWFGIEDPDVQSDLGRALIQAGAIMATQPGNALQGLAMGIAGGADAYYGARDARTAAEQAEMDRQIALEQWQMEYDQDQVALDLRAAEAQAKLAEAQGLSPDQMAAQYAAFENAVSEVMAANGLTSPEDEFAVRRQVWPNFFEGSYTEAPQPDLLVDAA